MPHFSLFNNMENEALFRDKPIWEAIFFLEIPSVLTIPIMATCNMADMFYIGMLGDDTQVAATDVVGPVFTLGNGVVMRNLGRIIMYFVFIWRESHLTLNVSI